MRDRPPSAIKWTSWSPSTREKSALRLDANLPSKTPSTKKSGAGDTVKCLQHQPLEDMMTTGGRHEEAEMVERETGKAERSAPKASPATDVVVVVEGTDMSAVREDLVRGGKIVDCYRKLATVSSCPL